MGRYPFLTVANKVLAKTSTYKSHPERGRKFRLLNRIVEGCHARGEISTKNPASFTDQDIGILIRAIKNGNCEEPGRRMRSPATSRKMIHYLEVVCDFTGNGVARKWKLENRSLVPREPPDKPIVVLETPDLERLVGGNWALDDDEWWDITARMAVCLYTHSGLRVGEGRTQEADGIDLENGVIHVTHPKGEGDWAVSGEQRPLMSEAVPIIREYLELRADKIRDMGYNLDDVPWFFIHVSENGAVGEWNERVWNKLKDQIVLHSGVRFQFRNLRATVGTKMIDDGTDPDNPNGRLVAIQAVSRCMGHRKTQTTEAYYARVRKDRAFSHVREAWKPLPVKSLKPPSQSGGD